MTSPRKSTKSYTNNDTSSTEPNNLQSQQSSSSSLEEIDLLPKTYFKSLHDQEQIRTALQKSSFFSCLDDEQINTFIQSVELKQYIPGQIVIVEGCIDFDNSSDTTRKNNDQLGGILTNDDTTIQSTTTSNDERSNINLISDTGEEIGESSNVKEDVGGSNEQIDKNSNTGTNTSEQPNSDSSKEEIRQDNEASSSVAPTEDQEQNDSTDDDDNSYSTSNNNHWTTMQNFGRTTNLESSNSEESLLRSPPNTIPPIPPQSGIPRSIYIIRKGHAQIWYQKPNTSQQQQQQKHKTITNHDSNKYLVNTIGPGTIFGEGGFLFGRQHSASVIASNTKTSSTIQNDDSNNYNDIGTVIQNEPLECWVMDIRTFRDFVLPSTYMQQIFHKYSTRHTNTINDSNVDTINNKEEPYVTMEDFLDAINEYQQLDHNNYGSRSVGIATTLYDSLIRLRLIENNNINYNERQIQNDHDDDEPKLYLKDFCFFFLLLARPDPEVDVAFLLMDEQQTGQIGINELQTVLRPVFPNLDFNSQFFQRYFGIHKNQRIRTKGFSQFLVDLQREIGQQAYIRAVQQQIRHDAVRPTTTTDGYLSPEDLIQILTTSCGWKLPSSVEQRLGIVYCHKHDAAYQNNTEGNKSSIDTISNVPNQNGYNDEYFSYGDFLAFQEVLGNLSYICHLIRRTEEFKEGPITSDDLKVVNREFGLGGRLSRRQVEIIFDLFDIDQDGYVTHADTIDVCGENFSRHLVPSKGPGNKLIFVPQSQNQPKFSDIRNDNYSDLLRKLSKEAFHFSIAMLVGGLSIFVLHPIDLIKTRLMNQRRGHVKLYLGPIDCMQQVIRKEGFASLFHGVQPQILGVAIERSIKLQVHHLLHQAFHVMDEEKDPDRKPSLLLEALAGGCAGACQLLVTNPMEITSIRMQMQGETARLLKERGIVPPKPSNLLGVIKDLGFPGVYRGASACLIRDVPFSALFFPTYVVCKEALIRHNANYTGKATAADIFYAGTFAGIPASLLTTPADVVKCRLQTIARPGEATYSGIVDCATKIYQQEGMKAFFQGSLMRVLRIAPQFGMSLLLYENLVNFVGFDKASRPPSNLPVDPDDYRAAFPERQLNESGYFEKWIRPKFSRES